MTEEKSIEKEWAD